jgi:hypothetical protein
MNTKGERTGFVRAYGVASAEPRSSCAGSADEARPTDVERLARPCSTSRAPAVVDVRRHCCQIQLALTSSMPVENRDHAGKQMTNKNAQISTSKKRRLLKSQT